MRTTRIAILAASAVAALAVAAPAPALAAPVLGLGATRLPASDPVPAGSYLKYTLAVSNTGTSETSENVTVHFNVPAGLKITSVSFEKPLEYEAWTCSTAPDSQSASCVGPEVELFPGFSLPLPIGPGEEACQAELGHCRIFVVVKADPNATPGILHPSIEACGGGAAACATAPDDPIEIIPHDFTIKSFDAAALEQNGDPDTQAGSHPYRAFTEFHIITARDSLGAELPIENTQDTIVELPPGVFGNPQAVATCTEQQLYGQSGNTNCRPESQVGMIEVQFAGETNFQKKPLYNMQTPPGSPALLAFNFFNTLVQVYAKVRSGEDYGVTAIVKNAPETSPFKGIVFTVWGVPADPGHDADRLCEGGNYALGPYGCASADAADPKPFFTLPTSCEGPGPNNSVQTSLELTSWLGSSDTASSFSHDNGEPEPQPIGAVGCNAVDFSPAIEARPTTNVADAASGLDVDVHIPQHEECVPGPPISCETAEAQLRDTTVTLPEGLTINPSGANGLGACSEAQFGYTGTEGNTIHTTPVAANCPDDSKLATVEVDSPLVDHPLKGAAYIATPYANPFNSLLALYIAIDDPQTGTVVKLAGEVRADSNTGRLTTSFQDSPQLPFEDFRLHFKGGAHGALRTPATCGNYTTTSSLTPWTAPESGPPAAPSDTWALSQAPGGGACPASSGARANAPDLDAGSVSPIAGAHSPTVVNLRRADGSQEFSTVTLTLPPGLTGKLAGVPYCPDSALSAAASRPGRQEETSPSCPAASRIGTADVSAGAGPAPYNTQGVVYLTGPYKGAPISIAIVTPATAGPFDLGTVVVRTALYVDRNSAQITAVSDPIPSILAGIPLDVRSALIKLDRPDFTLNGTSCDPLAFTGRLVSTLGQAAPLTERFQLGECSALSFKPKLALRLIGGTRRGAHPALRGTLTMPAAGANVARVSVALPHSEFLDQSHIGTVCTRVQFAAKECPAASVYGHAQATSPLIDYTVEGPVYLRSSSHQLPDLVMALHGPPSQPVEVDAVARIDSIKGGIRSTFEGVPDLPLSRVVLEMEGGKKGLLQNSTNICKGTHKTTAELDGQNGKAADLHPALQARCPKAPKHHRRHRRTAHRAVR
jgi:uncharacterized repeat protein (TIGR01451 family)